jgi:hypothetical protein
LLHYHHILHPHQLGHYTDFAFRQTTGEALNVTQQGKSTNGKTRLAQADVDG